MAEYINRASLINNLITFAPEHYTSLLNDLILKEPVADVVEYKGGEWTWEGSSWKPLDILEFEWCECSYCQKAVFFYDNQENDYAYCPHCGAKMERGWAENDA